MPTLNLTDRTIRGLREEEDRTEYYDTTLPGFGVRVTRAGRKTFILRYRNASGRPRKYTIGTYRALSLADARQRAREVLGDVARGEDPASERRARRAARTFGELAELYMEKHAKRRKRSWRYDRRMLDKDLLPAWGPIKAGEITRSDVDDLLDAIVDRGSPYAANRVRALASKVFSFGIHRGVLETNPVRDVALPAAPRSRQRVLTEDEIRTLWLAVDDEKPHPETGKSHRLTSPLMAAHFRLRLVTAQRGVEVLSMRWEDLDGEWWIIPADVAKNGLAHRVPLSDQARAEIEDLKAATGGGTWVFPSAKGDGHLAWVGKAAGELRERVGFDWIPHDLRRTAATHMTSMGIPRLVVAKILNHADAGVTAVYDRSSYDLEKRQALVAWGARVEEIVSGKDREGRIVGRIG